MIHYLRFDEAQSQPINASMLQDRARQFSERLKWPVLVDSMGMERDQYDNSDAIYVIVTNPDGNHAGSMRLLPTLGRYMISDHFSAVLEGKKIRHSQIWECSRLCVSPSSPKNVAYAVLVAGAKLMEELGIFAFIGVYDQQMEKVYTRLSIKPTTIGKGFVKNQFLSVGAWSFDNETYRMLRAKSGLSDIDLELSFVNSSIGKERMNMPIVSSNSPGATSLISIVDN